MKKLLTLAALLICSAALAQNMETLSGIPYREGALKDQCVLDIIRPEGKTGLPVVIWFHGGGLTMYDRHAMPRDLADPSYLVVTVEYRLLSDTVSIDDCLDDTAASVAWTLRHIREYGGDPDKVFLAGHSAGGYLLDIVGLDKRWLARYGEDPDHLVALIPFSGQVISHYAYRATLGMTPLQPLIDQYAPLALIRPDAPPIVIISGDREMELYGRYEEQAYFWRMLKLVGHPAAYLYELDGFSHGDMAEPACHILKSYVRSLLKK